MQSGRPTPWPSADRAERPARTLASARTLWGGVRSFAGYLDSLENPPTAPAQLRGSHWDGYLLAQKLTTRAGLMTAVRSVLRHADPLPVEFAARMHRTQVPRTAQKIPGYTKSEFDRVTAAARTHLSPCVRRIHDGRVWLQRWREGGVDRATDPSGWERGRLLDHLDRTGELPHFPSGHPHTAVATHGGTAAVCAQLYPTPHDIGAAIVLLICVTGHNHEIVAALPADHHRPDGDAGRSRTALVDTVKARRGSHASTSVALHDPGGGESRHRVDLSTAYAVHEAIHDICGPARERASGDGCSRTTPSEVGTGPPPGPAVGGHGKLPSDGHLIARWRT